MWEILGVLSFLATAGAICLAALFGMASIAEYAPTAGKMALFIFVIMVIAGAVNEYEFFKE